jgi:L-malate glycosyltransferase
VKAIHQFLAGYSKYDAISNEARLFQNVFRSWGFKSEIFCEPARTTKTANDIIDIRQAQNYITPKDTGILHLSIGCMANEIFPTLSCRKALIYHNITPPEYLRGFHEELAGKLEWGRKQIKNLNKTADILIADSSFNAKELISLGYNQPKVLPLMIDLSALRAKGEKRILKMLNDKMVNILFVGRYVPNKRLEDVLHTFYFFQKYCRAESRLIFAGSGVGMERYEMLLKSMAIDLQLQNVIFTGTVTQLELNAYYQSADAFLCMSEHEGFCIPLLEAMINHVPVFAFAAAAVPETLSDSGILVYKKRYDFISEVLLRVLTDAKIRNSVIKKQDERIEKYESRDLEAELRSVLTPILNK